jgi:hypothetical protein
MKNLKLIIDSNIGKTKTARHLMGGGGILALCFTSLNAQVTYSVNTNVTSLSLNPGVVDGITIAANVTVTMTGCTINFNSNKEVLLNPGSKLILDNCIFQTSTSNITWKGIVANGNSGIEQYSTFPDPNFLNNPAKWKGVYNSSQTRIEVLNSTIKHAIVGIESINGSIVETSNSVYRNNQKSIFIHNYYSNSTPKVNASLIMDCDFEWDDNAPSSFSIINHVEVHLQEIGAFRLGGSNFINDWFTSPSAPNTDDGRGEGVRISDASLIISKSGSFFCEDDDGCIDNCGSGSAGNTFEGYSCCIKFIENTPNDNALIARNCIFTNFLSGVYTENGNTSVLIQNIFNNSSNFIDDNFATGVNPKPYSMGYPPNNIYTLNSKLPVIIKNEFNLDNVHKGTMVAVHNPTNGKTEIKKNKFTTTSSGSNQTHQNFGIILDGSNTGIEVHCNEFVEMGVDVQLESGSTTTNLGTGVNLPGTNIWSSFITNRYNIFNNGGSPINYHHDIDESGMVNGSLPGTSVTKFLESQNSSICNFDCNDYRSFLLRVNVISVGFDFKIFPNPCIDEVNISSKTIIERYEVYSLSGKLIKSGDFKNDMTIDLNDVNSGLLCIKCYSPTGAFISKLVQK